VQCVQVCLDGQTLELLEVAAGISQLEVAELAAQIIVRDLVARTGWPGGDGLRMRKALADYRSSAAGKHRHP
jgi:hypothetical protein